MILEEGEYQTLNIPCTKALPQVHSLMKSIPLLIWRGIDWCLIQLYWYERTVDRCLIW